MIPRYFCTGMCLINWLNIVFWKWLVFTTACICVYVFPLRVYVTTYTRKPARFSSLEYNKAVQFPCDKLKKNLICFFNYFVLFQCLLCFITQLNVWLSKALGFKHLFADKFHTIVKYIQKWPVSHYRPTPHTGLNRILSCQACPMVFPYFYQAMY